MNDLKPYHYYCSISFGNVSQLETKQAHKNLKAFLRCFYVTDYNIKHMKDADIPYYIAEVHYSDYSELKRNRFAQAVLAFALYHGMGYAEE